MSTAQTIVDNALQDLGAQTELVPATPDTVARSLEALVDMLNRWASVTINLGITIPVLIGDELGEPSGVKTALESNLAIELQTIVKVDAKPRLFAKAKRSYGSMKAAFGLTPEQSFPASLPLGTGNTQQPRTKKFFAEPDSVGSSNNTGLGA